MYIVGLEAVLADLLSTSILELIFTPPDPILILREGDRLNLTCESSQDIFIDSSNTEVQGEVRGRPRYETRNLEYLLSFVTGALRAGEGGTVSCRFKSNNGSAHDWKFNVIESPGNNLGIREIPYSFKEIT
jgi:hypothetical protein